MKREEEIRARLAAEFRYWKSDTRDDITDVQAHGRFISNAPSDIDYLLKENQKLRDVVEVLRDNMVQALAYTAQCPECERLLPNHADDCELQRSMKRESQ